MCKAFSLQNQGTTSRLLLPFYIDVLTGSFLALRIATAYILQLTLSQIQNPLSAYT